MPDRATHRETAFARATLTFPRGKHGASGIPRPAASSQSGRSHSLHFCDSRRSLRIWLGRGRVAESVYLFELNLQMQQIMLSKVEWYCVALWR
jgi:hypothetical protein